MSIYLDNAATTFPKPEEVYQAADRILRAVGVAPGRGGHHRSLEAARVVFQARETLAALLGINESSRIIFTHSATEALNLLAYSYGRHFLKAGDEVLIGYLEHDSNRQPWQLKAKRHGVVVKEVPVPSGEPCCGTWSPTR